MPGLDRSGPMGQGAMTGGGRGLCGTRGTLSSEGSSPDIGRGLFCRRGFRGRGGRGFGRGAGFNQLVEGQAAMQQPADEVETLRNQAQQLQQSLSRIEQRLDALTE